MYHYYTTSEVGLIHEPKIMESKKRRRKDSETSVSSNSSGSSDRSRQEVKRRKKLHKKQERRGSKIGRSYTPPLPKVNLVCQGTGVSTLGNLIPQFDPQSDSAAEWTAIVDENIKVYNWSDNYACIQALSKLRGNAKTWYENFIKNEVRWASFSWRKWKKIILGTFSTKRNVYELFMNVANP